MEEKKKTQQELLKETVTEVTSTQAGKLLFKYLHSYCGFVTADTSVGSTGEINPLATVYHSALRNVYVSLRKNIPKEFLLEIEH